MTRARDRASGDFDGKEIFIDADADTSITADTDDQIDVKIAGSDKVVLDANGVKINGSTSGGITLAVPAEAGSNTLTLPASTQVLANTPTFVVRLSSAQTISDNTVTKVTFDTEDVDTDSAFASNKFTVPTGKAGLYKFDVIVRLDSAANDNLHSSIAYLYKDGTAQSIVYNNYVSHYTRAITMNISQILDLSADEYIEVYVACNTVNGGDATVTHNKYSIFSGHKLIT